MVEKERKRLIKEHTAEIKKSFSTMRGPAPKNSKSSYSFFRESVLYKLIRSMPVASPNSHLSFGRWDERNESVTESHLEKVSEIMNKPHNAEDWEKMSENERAPFVSSAECDQRRFDQEMAKFKNPENDVYNNKLNEYDRQVKGWKADLSSSDRPRILVHAGMTCKAWRDIIRIGKDPKSTALTVLAMSHVDDLMAIREAMRFCIISEGKDKVFQALLAQWVETVGVEAVRGELAQRGIQLGGCRFKIRHFS